MVVVGDTGERGGGGGGGRDIVRVMVVGDTVSVMVEREIKTL